MNKENIHFEGDESWSLENIPDKKIFFKGWFMNKKGKLLEAGCGVGNYMVILSKYGFDVIGIEISKERADIAKKNLKKYGVKAKVLVGDVRRLPFKDNSFDIIFSNGVVEHFIETEKAIKEMNRVLKKGGFAMISVPNRFTIFRINKNLQILIGRILKKQIWKCGFEQSFRRTKFRKMLKRAGFKVIEEKVSECGPGKRYPMIGKILRILDKPLYVIGVGGHFNSYFCKKV